MELGALNLFNDSIEQPFQLLVTSIHQVVVVVVQRHTVP